MIKSLWRFSSRTCVIAALSAAGGCAAAQTVADPGFKSVGRGAPILADINKYEIVGAALQRPFGPPGNPEGRASCSAYVHRLGAYGDVPKGITPLPVDLFTSKDFYKDQKPGPTSAIFRCNSSVAIEEMWGANGVPLIDGAKGPSTAAWGNCDRDYPRAAIVSPYHVQDRAGTLRSAARRDEEARRPDAAHLRDGPGEWTGRYQQLHSQSGDAVVVVPPASQPDVDDPVAADARISEAHGPAGVSRRRDQPRAVAVAILLARRLHAPLARVRDVGLGHHRHAAGRADHGRRGGQLRHEHLHRQGVQDGRRRAASGPAGAALVRRDRRLLGQGRAHHLDEQRAGLDEPRRAGVLEQDADHRDLRAEPRRERQVHRSRTTRRSSTIPNRWCSRCASCATTSRPTT